MPWPLIEVADLKYIIDVARDRGQEATIGMWCRTGEGAYDVMIILPPGYPDGNFGGAAKWSPQGEMKHLTLSPSIKQYTRSNKVCYHGHITGGMITDDLKDY
jgi:hypothetical protein